MFAKMLSQLNEPRNLRMKDFVVTEQRGTLLPSDVMWNHQIAGRKSLPHTLADSLSDVWQSFVPGFYFPQRRALDSISKVHSEAAYELCNHLKINYFQKKRSKMPFSLPTKWGGLSRAAWQVNDRPRGICGWRSVRWYEHTKAAIHRRKTRVGTDLGRTATAKPNL